MTFTVEVDFLGNGHWKTFTNVFVKPHGYSHLEFPDAFSAHWVRLKADRACQATAHFVYN